MIPKKQGGKRMLGIPTMKDRAMQAIWQQALDPVAEVLSDPFSHGFRKLRSCWDAREHLHRLFAAACRARWVLDADIEKCFDKLSHEWLLKNIPLPKRVLSGWLRCGVMEGLKRSDTIEGTPQGGVISPTLANLALNGLIEELDRRFVGKTRGVRKTNPRLLNAVRYADDFLITGRKREFIEEEVVPSVERFLSARGLRLSRSKTRVRHISEGFDFLGYSVRKYANGKLIIKPSKGSIKRFKERAGQILREGRGLPARVTFKRLNQLLNGWGRYFRTAVSKAVFSALDSWLHHKILRWGMRRHNQWGVRRVYREYFPRDRRGRCRPFRDGVALYLLAMIPIKRHASTPFDLNPYRHSDAARVKRLLRRRAAQRFRSSLLAGSW
jgi:RNA-directed DNA polymerase